MVSPHPCTKSILLIKCYIPRSSPSYFFNFTGTLGRRRCSTFTFLYLFRRTCFTLGCGALCPLRLRIGVRRKGAQSLLCSRSCVGSHGFVDFSGGARFCVSSRLMGALFLSVSPSRELAGWRHLE